MTEKMKFSGLTHNFKPIKSKKRCAETENSDTRSAPKPKFDGDNLIVAVLLILFIIILNLVSIFGYLIKQEWKLFKTKIFDDFYVPCSSLSLSPDEDYIRFDINKSGLKTYADEKGVYVCSGKNLTALVETIVERVCRIQEALGKEERYLSCGNENLTEASGYQNVFFREILKHQNSSDKKLYWNNHPSKCYLDNSIKYENGEVTIPEGQNYYLYASVHFNISEKTSIDQKGSQIPQRMTLRICKSVYEYEQTLTAKSKLFDMTTTGNVVGSLRVETHVHLRKNDKIYVRVNDASSIIHSSKGIDKEKTNRLLVTLVISVVSYGMLIFLANCRSGYY